MSRRYTQEQENWLKEYIPGHKQHEIAEMFTKTFGREMTPSQVKSYKGNRKIHSGTSTGRSIRTVWIPEYEEFLKQNAKGNDGYKLAEMLNERFGTSFRYKQIKSAMSRFRIRNGIDCRYQYGRLPNENSIKKGQHLSPKTEFGKGHVPSNKHEIGSIVRRADGNPWIKYGEDSYGWMPLKRYVWEQHNGPIPKRHCIVTLDGNPENCDISNLEIISQSENAVLTHKRGLRKEDPELARTGILIARLIASNSKQTKRRKEK